MIRNIGLSTTTIDNAPQHLLTDIEQLNFFCVFWGGWDLYPEKFHYTDFPDYITDGKIHNYDTAWYSIPGNSDVPTVIHGVHVYHRGARHMSINTNPQIDITWKLNSEIN